MYDDPTIYQTSSAGAQANPIFMVLYLAVLALMVASLWKLFVKAGKPGWAAIIPFYNTIVLLEIVGRPVWWFVLLFVPLVNIVVAVVVLHDLSKSFGKGVGTTLLNFFFPYIGLPLLAWGDAAYAGPAAAEGGSTPSAPVAPAPPVAPAA